MTSAGNVEESERLRLFCALRLHDAVIERLEPWQHEHLSGGRLVRPEDLHITLAFLGSRPRSELPAITTQLREAAKRAKRPRLSVWRYHETSRVGMLVLQEGNLVLREGNPDAAFLAADLQQRLETLGVFRREHRPWKAHITVIRFRERPRLDPPLPDLGTVRPSDAAVYMSILRPTGAQYEVLESVPLGRRLIR